VEPKHQLAQPFQIWSVFLWLSTDFPPELKLCQSPFQVIVSLQWLSLRPALNVDFGLHIKPRIDRVTLHLAQNSFFRMAYKCQPVFHPEAMPPRL
jgi:hypothetical protein